LALEIEGRDTGLRINEKKIKQVLLALEIEGRDTGLRINEKKIKYKKMPST